MCTGNDSGNSVMQKTLWCDNLYRQNITTLEIHYQLMLMFGDDVLRQRYLGRGYREFKSELASIMKITLFNLADQEYENTAPVVEMVLDTHQDTIQDLPIALDWYVKTATNIVLVQLGYISVCVCVWLVPRYVMVIHKNWCLEVLFDFFSYLKEEQTGSMHPWWHCETWVPNFTQNELQFSGHIRLQWEPQNVMYAGKLWHLYSRLQKSSALYS